MAAKRDLDKDYANSCDVCDACNMQNLLPDGIVRVTDEAIASKHLIEQDPSLQAGKKVQIAVFDFDGTCISGYSSRKLVYYLARSRRLNPYKLFRVGLWGAAYKLNLPKDAEGVRSRVFSAFKGLPAQKVNSLLCRFYSNEIAPIFRVDADATMTAHIQEGHVVVLVSAAFEPIIAAAMGEHPIQFACASRMQVKDDIYTGEVEGLPTEGPDKLTVLSAFADKYFGEGNWEIGWSYADHYSDLKMLSAAKNPCAVTPDRKLKAEAKKRGWQILNWV